MNKLAAALHLPILPEWRSRTAKTTNHRMRQSKPSLNDQKILDYWVRRSQGLSEAEWQDFYRLTVPLLMATQLPAEYSDRAARRDLVDIFFAEKIFLNAGATRAGALENVHALHTYLKRFVVDIQRRNGQEVPEDSVPLETIAAQAVMEDYGRILTEAGIDPDQASRSAGQFLATLDPGEAAYLRHHTCAEHEEKDPISSIAERLSLGSSYHYKAKQLGITRSKGETYVGYEKTKIGRWLLSVGAKLNEEWREELAVLLSVLCRKVFDPEEAWA